MFNALTSARGATEASNHTPVARSYHVQIMYLMEIDVSDVQLIKNSVGQYNAVVYLFAWNNLTQAPTYFEGARVQLETLNVTLSYDYQSASGAKQTASVTVKPNQSLVLTPEENMTLTVDTGALPFSSTGPIDVHITGGYTRVMHSTRPGPGGATIYETAYCQGRLLFAKTLVIQP